KRIWLSAAAAAAIACATFAPPAFAQDGDISTAPRYGVWGYETGGQDLSVKPGDDFYRFAQGLATDQMQIPADRSRYGNFDKLTTLSEARVHAVLEKAKEDPDSKIGNLYSAFLDEKTVEKLGAKPMAADLAAVRAVTSREQLAHLQGATTDNFGRSFFDVYIDADLKDPDRYALYLNQAGLGLPDRDYYLDEKFAEKKAAYQDYVAKTLKLAGWTDPEANAKAIVDMETKIAEVSWTRADSHDPDKTYNPATIAELKALAPGYPWEAYLDGAHVGMVNRVVVGENTAFPKIAEIYASTPLDVLKAWEAFTVADGASPFLSQPFVDNHFEFRSKTLQGQPEQKPRWRRAVTVVNGAMGEAVGEKYVDAYFPADSKAKMEALVSNLKAAMAGRIERVDWMSDETKARALEKLSKFGVKIGYPDKWRDYSNLQIVAGDLYGNVERASAFEWARNVARLDEPVDKDEWGMTPQTVNAYYNPPNNEIVFPAAILQPPFFDPSADPAINYGAIGGVIGHEITHGFDDDGRKFDGDGKLNNWWTEADLARFTAETEKLSAQYSQVEPLPGIKINGELTMGENIADLGGLLMALDAYHASLKGKPAPIIDGLTGDQRVFLGWAQVWRGKYRDDALKQQLVSDPHSPNTARVNEPMRNIDAWYAAFNVKPGDALYLPPEERVHIW
ncbi:MAG TPA: M13-type metalloendopeptidase, partial [Caulobacteraceae bacterium]